MPLQARDKDDKKQAVATAVTSVPVREPELASRALARIQQCIEKAEDQRLKVTATGALSNDQESEIRNSFTLHVKAEIAKILAPLHPADIAYILEALPPDERLIVWDLVRNQQDGEVLLEVNDAVRETLLEAMDREEMVDAMETLDTDEIADLVEDLPPDVVAEVQEGLSSQERAQLRAAMSYPEDSVGARMDFEIVSVQEGQSLEAVFRYLRSLDELPELTDMIFVVDRQQKLKGALPVSRILISDPERTVKELMKGDVLTLNPLDDASDAAQAFERYDLVSAPVVDETDEVMDVIRESGDEDAYAAVGLSDEQDLFGSVWEAAKSRWIWLGLNLCTAFFASRVISCFEDTISRVVALATLLPIVAGIAGNTGNQTLTLLVRSIAMGQVTQANRSDLFKKELCVALINGFLWGVIAGLAAWLLYADSGIGIKLGLVMFLAMMLNIVVGALVGLIVPLALKRMDRDPAVGSSVLLTFITDSGGFLIFLGLAAFFF